jgi:hypothetical protein
MAAPCAELWTVEITRDWMDKTPTSTHDLWPLSSLGRWHSRSSVRLVLTRHSSPILNERWTHLINLSMFFLLCYDLTTIWGHEPCIGFFLWQFKMPDALICYPGSIEKLKLLGATYLLTWYDYKQACQSCRQSMLRINQAPHTLKQTREPPCSGVSKGPPVALLQLSYHVSHHIISFW